MFCEEISNIISELSSFLLILPGVCVGEDGTFVCENSGSQIGELSPYTSSSSMVKNLGKLRGQFFCIFEIIFFCLVAGFKKPGY